MIQQDYQASSEIVTETFCNLQDIKFKQTVETARRIAKANAHLAGLAEDLTRKRRTYLIQTEEEMNFAYLLTAFICAVKYTSLMMALLRIMRTEHNNLSQKEDEDSQIRKEPLLYYLVRRLTETKADAVLIGRGQEICYPISHQAITECEYATCSNEDYPPASRYYPIRMDSADMVAQMENHFKESGFPLSCLVSNQTARDEYGIDIDDENVAFCVVI